MFSFVDLRAVGMEKKIAEKRMILTKTQHLNRKCSLKLKLIKTNWQFRNTIYSPSYSLAFHAVVNGLSASGQLLTITT